MRTVLALALALVLSGCAVVRFNDGATVAIEHDGRGADNLAAADEAAVKACVANGKTGAEVLRRGSVNPYLPGAFSRQLSTYRCT